jgi:hypothetical protein
MRGIRGPLPADWPLLENSWSALKHWSGGTLRSMDDFSPHNLAVAEETGMIHD